MSIVRSLIGYAPAVVLPRIVSLVLVLILTRLISSQEYGLFVLVMTLGEMIDDVDGNWVRIALARFASAHTDDFGREETLRSLGLYGLTLLPALAVAVAAGLLTCPIDRPSWWWRSPSIWWRAASCASPPR